MGALMDLMPWILGALAILVVLERILFRPSARRSRKNRKSRFPAGTLPGRVIKVIDGDGLVAEVKGIGRISIRLAYIDAPEHDQPWGNEAKEALEELAAGREASFRLLRRDRFARAVAKVSIGRTVLNEELVRRGHAWAYMSYLPRNLRGRYVNLEQEARQRGKGLWSASRQAVAPWEWRKGRGRGLLAFLARLLGRLGNS